MSRFILIIILIFLAADVLCWLYARSLYRKPNTFDRRHRQLIAFICVTGIASLAVLIFGRYLELERYVPVGVLIVTLVWHLLAVPYAVLLILLHGTTQAGRFLFGKRARKTENSPEPVLVSDSPLVPAGGEAVSRRDFVRSLVVFSPALLSVTGSAYGAAKLDSLRVREIEIQLPGLPSRLDGLSIAHVSDTHLGRFTDAKAFRSIVSAVNELDTDLVLHTGDLINNDQDDLPMAAQLLREMKSRHGLYLCEGNHDLIEGREGFESFMRREKMPILIDQIAGLEVNGERIELLGLQWTRGARTSGADTAISEGVARLAARRSTSAFPILLAHHPHAFDPAVAAGIPLTLGGHTHGGQLHLSPTIGFGPAMYRYWSGLYSRDGCHAVISNGAGNWFPIRLNAPAEIARITLRRA